MDIRSSSNNNNNEGQGWNTEEEEEAEEVVVGGADRGGSRRRSRRGRMGEIKVRLFKEKAPWLVICPNPCQTASFVRTLLVPASFYPLQRVPKH